MARAAPQNIAFVGGGNMASALIGGLCRTGVPAATIKVAECNPEQCDRLVSQYGVVASTSSRDLLESADTVVWAVKPQVLQVAMQDNGDFCRGALHVSIAAGVKVSSMSVWLQSERIVRAMPNTSSLVSAGVTGMFAGSAVGDLDMRAAEKILRCAGEVFWVATEDAMDAVTAVSGSGPAYFLYFLEAFQRAAEGVGFDQERSRSLALQVAAGALRQAGEGPEAFEVLRQKVTSKGGTTEAAISVLECFKTSDAIVRAVGAAADRSRTLAGQFKPAS